MQISGSEPLFFTGTILAGGTLTSEIDMADASMVGVIATTVPANGTLTFQVASKSDSNGGTYVDLYADDGTRVSVTAPAATFAVSQLVLAPLIGYRYIKIKSSVTQTNGLRFELPARP